MIKNWKYMVWVLFFILAYPLLFYSLSQRWGDIPSILTITVFYMTFKPWLLSPLEGDFTRERTRVQDLVDWFKNIGKTGKYKDFK